MVISTKFKDVPEILYNNRTITICGYNILCRCRNEDDYIGIACWLSEWLIPFSKGKVSTRYVAQTSINIEIKWDSKRDNKNQFNRVDKCKSIWQKSTISTIKNNNI